MAAKPDRRRADAALSPDTAGGKHLLTRVAAALARELTDMAVDVRALKPYELVQLVNSTPAGEVLSVRRLKEHRTAAGFRIGDGKTVDLFRYTAWLFDRARRSSPEDGGSGGVGGGTSYEAHKERARARNATMSASGRDIGPLPAIKDPERKARAERSLQAFCELYFPQTFHLAWSQDHLTVIGKIEQAVIEGGLFALAMPRGSGKTSLCEIACLWAILFGHRAFICLIGASEAHAEEMLDSLKTELESNELLLEDFPEAVFPIHCLEGIANRCAGQLYQGERTCILWTSKEIVLPTIKESRASGAIVKIAGLTGRIRGMKFKRADGRSVRPSLVIVDDPQTDESARSPAQCAERERILAGAVLGLAGPGKKISGIMPCTVIRGGDMADRILDRDKHPQWQGERMKLCYAFPTHEKLWQEYSEIRGRGLREERGTGEATEFYRARQEAMDAGGRAAWPERHDPDELSALQHIMNLRLDRGDAAFFAEFQNEPLEESGADDKPVEAEEILGRADGRKRGVVPLPAQHLTAFIDVQEKLLYWMVCGWDDEFGGAILDYGTFPDQRLAYFTLKSAKQTLAALHPHAGLEGRIHAGLTALTNDLLAKRFPREDRVDFKIGLCLIDAGWGRSTDVVYDVCRRNTLLLPSHGQGIGAATAPMETRRRKPGERHGQHWIVSSQGQRRIRHALIDTNFWKSFLQARLQTAIGDAGALTLFGAARDQDQHRLLAEHLTAESRTQTSGRGRTVEEWRPRPGLDNHWLDTLVGCAAAASILGVSLNEHRPPPTAAPLKLSDLQKQKYGTRKIA